MPVTAAPMTAASDGKAKLLHFQRKSCSDMLGFTLLFEEVTAAEVMAARITAAPVMAANDGDAKVFHFKPTRVTAALRQTTIEGLLGGSFGGCFGGRFRGRFGGHGFSGLRVSFGGVLCQIPRGGRLPTCKR